MAAMPILFLHGAFAGPEVWTRFVAPWFAARGHRVAAPRLYRANGLPIDPHWRSLAWRINAWLDEQRIGVRAGVAA